MRERLQKIISRAGIASRRRAEQLILSGMVTVNGRAVTTLGTKADLARDHIKVSGKLLHPPKARIYLALHKPAEVVATLSDPEGRRTLAELLSRVPKRVFPIGRLEYAASGLVLLTNDGDFANRLLRAHGLRQTYRFKIKGGLGPRELEEIARVAGAKLGRASEGENPWYEVTLVEASRDLLRRKLGEMGHPVEKTKRVQIGPVELGALPPGRHRALTGQEVKGLERAAAGASRPGVVSSVLARSKHHANSRASSTAGKGFPAE